MIKSLDIRVQERTHTPYTACVLTLFAVAVTQHVVCPTCLLAQVMDRLQQRPQNLPPFLLPSFKARCPQPCTPN